MKNHKIFSVFLLALLMSAGVIFFINIPFAKAAVEYWSYGFESWEESPFDGVVADATITDVLPNSGTYHGRADPTAGGGSGYFYRNIDETSADVRWYYRFNSAFLATSYGVDMIRLMGDGSERLYVNFNAANDYVYVGVYSGNFSYYDTGGMDTDYHSYRLIANITQSGYFDILFYLDDVEVIDCTLYDSGFNDFSQFRIGHCGGGTGYGTDYYFDDILWGGSDLVSIDLEPDNTGVDWVFTDWRYYTFTATIPSSMYSGDLDYCYIGFTEILTANGTVGFSAWSNSSGWDWAFNTPFPDRDLDPIRGKAGSWSNTSDETVITFPLWFTKKCLDIWESSDAVDVLLRFNDTTGADSGWFTAYSNAFRIYTDGGFSRVYDGYGTSGTLPGGRDFNMFAYNNSYIFKDMYWRDLVHIKLVPEIQFYAGYQYFQLVWGIDYVLKDGSYVSGLKLVFEPDAVSYTGVFASNVWINYTASWYSNDTLVKSDDLYAFYHGDVSTAGDIGHAKFFIDFWFDEGNASTLQGGRINAYEYPMQDTSGAWLRWLSSNWGVKDDVFKQSECIAPVHNVSSSEGLNSENIEFVRVWSALTVPADEYDQYVAVISYDIFDTTFSQEKGVVKGIQTPPWDETNMPVMRNTGVLGAVWSMFQGIGAWLSENILFGGLNLWGTFVAFLDTIVGWFGAPYFFTNLFNWLGEAFNGMLIGASYAWEVVANIFILIASMIGAFVNTVAELVLSFATFISNFVDFIGGGLGAGADLWTELGISTWITVAIIFYPLYLVILWEEKGMGAVIEQLTWIFGLLVWLYHFFEGLIMGAITLVTAIIESIPVAE